MANVSIDVFKTNRSELFKLIDCYTGMGVITRYTQKCNDKLKPLVLIAKTVIESADIAIAYYDTATNISSNSDTTDITKVIQPQMNEINPQILKSIQEINDVKSQFSGENPMHMTTARQPPKGGKRSRRYNKKSKKTMRRRGRRTYRKK